MNYALGIPHEPYEVWGQYVPRIRQDAQFHPEGLGRYTPYGFSIGFEGDYAIQPILLFYGDEYVIGADGLVWPVGCGFGFGEEYHIAFGFNLFKSVGKFCSNAVKTAGKGIGTVTKGIQDVHGAVGKAIGKIPVVGGPLHTIFDVGYHATFGMVNTTTAIMQGKRIDRAVMDHLNQQLTDFKQVGPYAQMVIGMVPGVGQGVSAAMAAGLALANGQPITEVLKAGAIGAIPGGALVQACVKAGVDTIQKVAKGERLDLASLAKTAGGVAGGALGLPPASQQALMAGISTAGAIAQGKPLDKSLTDGVVSALPIPEVAKKAMKEASALTIDLASGKRVDRSLMNRIDGVMGMLPVDSTLRENLKTGVTAVRRIGEGKKAEEVMMSALQSGIADQLISSSAAKLPKALKDGLKTGIALGTGASIQDKRFSQLTKGVPGKLLEIGIQTAKTAPLFDAGRKIAASKGGSKGYNIATGLLSSRVGVFDVATVRNALPNPADKLGFDMAAATRIGAVTHPKPPTLSPAAHAGHAITLGMQSYVPERKAAIMKTVQAIPSAAVGATAAVKEVAKERASFWQKILKALRLSK